MLTRQRGEQAENIAYHFLQQKNMSLLERNFTCRHGEIDLIMRDHNTLVFIEVRMRSNRHFGFAEETVQQKKRTKIIRSAAYFLQTHGHWFQYPSRFDVIAVDAAHEVHWIQDAFSAPAW